MFKSIYYFGDTARVPYGNKDAVTITHYCLEAIDFFEKKNIELLIIACNTASATALINVQNKASFPIVGVIDPGVESVIESINAANDRVLVIGTHQTINSEVYQRKLLARGFTNISGISSNLLVSLVEEEITDAGVINQVLRHYFSGVDEPDCVLLGCTHFPHLTSFIQQRFPNALLVHSGNAMLTWLKKHGFLSECYLETEIHVFATDRLEKVKEFARDYLKHTII